MTRKEQVMEWLRQCKFENYELDCYEVDEDHVVIYGTYVDLDTYTALLKPQRTREWTIDPLWSRSQVIQTVFKLCLTSMEHRCREGFTYRGRRVYGPHIDVDALWEVCKHEEAA